VGRTRGRRSSVVGKGDFDRILIFGQMGGSRRPQVTSQYTGFFYHTSIVPDSPRCLERIQRVFSSHSAKKVITTFNTVLNILLTFY
jgi:hypothetical protein